MTVIIGTSGYDYSEWVGEDRFYPASLEKDRPDWLTYYASQFKAIELNFTYYGEVKPGQLESMVRRVDPARTLSLIEGDFSPHPDFQFIIKAYSSLTHRITDDWRQDAHRFREDIEPLVESGKLSGVLAQFPSRFKPTENTLTYIVRLAEKLSPVRLIFEARLGKWFDDKSLRPLADHGVVICGLDTPDEAKLPRTLGEGSDDSPLIDLSKFDTPLEYHRMHGRREGYWWSGDNASRYEYQYSQHQLEIFAKRLRTSKKTQTYVMFNNHRNADAPKNASRLEALLNEMADMHSTD